MNKGERGRWVHRCFDLSFFGDETFEYVVLAVDGSKNKKGTYRAYYKNIWITDGEKPLMKFYTNEADIPCGEARICPYSGVKKMTNFSVEPVKVPELSRSNQGR